MNWFYPPIWTQIVDACRVVGWPFSPADIKRYLDHNNRDQFKTLHPQRISEWIDKSKGSYLHFTESVQQRVGTSQVLEPGGHTTRVGILVSGSFTHKLRVISLFNQEQYPAAMLLIVRQLKGIREASVPLDLTTIRGLMIGILEVHAREIFTYHVGNDGKTFQCSEAFVGRFVN